jgi:hypothetical protein
MKRGISDWQDDTDQHSTAETTYYRYCRGHDGRLYSVDVAKRNGRAVPLFPPSAFESESLGDGEHTSDFLETVEIVTYDLTEVQRRTFLRLTIDGRSILDVAKEEAVSRAAIYARIRAMVHRNLFVKAWWLNKNKVNQHI